MSGTGALTVDVGQEFVRAAVRDMLRRALVEDRELVASVLADLGYLTVADAARWCGVGPAVLKAAMAAGALPYAELGYKTKSIRLADLEQWMRERTRRGRGRPALER